MSYTKAVKGQQNSHSATVPLPGLTLIDDAAASAHQYYAQQGQPFLCQGPDGQQALYVYDNERSIPGVSRILKRIYPPT
jgi:hypothetical protein